MTKSSKRKTQLQSFSKKNSLSDSTYTPEQFAPRDKLKPNAKSNRKVHSREMSHRNLSSNIVKKEAVKTYPSSSYRGR